MKTTRAKRHRPVAGEAGDIQAIVGSGFASRRYCTYRLFAVDDPVAARRWLRELLRSGLVRTVADLGARRGAGRDEDLHHSEIATLAFTYAGLRRLSIDETPEAPFPTAFRMGMTHPVRAKLIGDLDRSAWTWGDRDDGDLRAVHVLVIHFRKHEAVGGEGPLGSGALAASGLTLVRRCDSCPAYYPAADKGSRKSREIFEPFGFRDSLAQPVVRGLRASVAHFAADGSRDGLEHPTVDDGRPPARPQTARDLEAALREDNSIAPGEFVLGHPTEYNEPAYCPDVDGWSSYASNDDAPARFGFNGTYLAARQIVQDVDGFRRFVAEHPGSDGGASEAERMVGRRVDGRPLLTCPSSSSTVNDFRYRLNDGDGFQCPRGAHIRRANPRDGLGWDVASGVRAAKLHRLLRRGRPFVAATDDAAQTPICAAKASNDRCDDARYRSRCGKGIFFIALNADLERQFELVQKRWLNSTSFPDLYRAADPLVGTTTPNEFSTQGVPQGGTVAPLAAFTHVVGGGYFFVPGLKALAFIVGDT